MRKSIQTKIICLVIAGIVLSAAAIGVISAMRFRKAMEEECIEIMNLSCQEKAEELNVMFGRLEQSVEILAKYAADNLESVERLQTDREYLKKYAEGLEELGLTIANETSGAVAIYARFSKDLLLEEQGYFYVYDSEQSAFGPVALTDLSLYEPDDLEHVGWYYMPIAAGHAIWMETYYNKNLNIDMISYISPVYLSGELVAVVGMDIDFRYIAEQVDEIKLYETGHAFLTDEALNVIYGRHIPKGTGVRTMDDSLVQATYEEIVSPDSVYSFWREGKERRVVFDALSNGMCLAVTAPMSEVYADVNVLMLQNLGAMIVCILVFTGFAILFAGNIIRPIKELDHAAREIARGNLDIALECKTEDEVKTLTESFKETARQLKIRIDYINNLAFLDKLTGIHNNTAYLSEVCALQEEITQETCDFAVFVMDVNGLKYVNDTYGHDFGNELLIEASNVLKTCFGYENVYRMGGDEFVAIKRNISYDVCEELAKKFDRLLSEHKGRIHLVAALGYAKYVPASRETYDEVFKRADAVMYEKKQVMKARGENSEVLKEDV